MDELIDMAEVYVATRGTDWGHTIRLEDTTHDFDGNSDLFIDR